MRFYCFFLLLTIFLAAVSAWNPFPEDMKTSWPELVGKDGDEAADIIKSECEDCNVRVRPEHSPMTMDLRINRVRVFVNADNIVVAEPRRG